MFHLEGIILYIRLMLSSLDIGRVIAEAKDKIVDSTVLSIEYYRKERAAQLYLKSDRRYCLTISFHPDYNGFYFLPAGKSKIDTSEKYRPFAKEIWSGTITRVEQTPNDRMVEIEIFDGSTKRLLFFEILGPNGNLWYLDGDRKKIQSLRQKSFNPGDLYEITPIPEKISLDCLSPETLKELIAKNEENQELRPVKILEKNIYGIDYQLATHLIGVANYDRGAGGDGTVEAERDEQDFSNENYISEICKRAEKLSALYKSNASSIYVYRIKGKNRFYPFRLPGIDNFEKFKSLSEAQRLVTLTSKDEIKTESLKDRTIRALTTRLKKSNKLITNLEADVNRAADFQKYREISDLLKINLSHIDKRMAEITVADLFHDEVEIVIKLDQKLTPQENIEAYARRFRKGKEGIDLLQRRLTNARDENNQLRAVLDQFEAQFDTAQHRYPEYIPTDSTSIPGKTVVRKPYRVYQTSTGLTIFVGKTGGDNDRTTFEYAKPYELWFHASQCPGSHVVLKFPHKNFQPSRVEIEETAALAAWHSKARNAAKVPVSYTQKKYVRKPRKTKAGLVTLERQKSIMVIPTDIATTVETDQPRR